MRAAHTDLGESSNSLNSLEVATTSEGIERQSCLWTTGVSALDHMGSGLAMSMSTVKLEGVGVTGTGSDTLDLHAKQ